MYAARAHLKKGALRSHCYGVRVQLYYRSGNTDVKAQKYKVPSYFSCTKTFSFRDVHKSHKINNLLLLQDKTFKR